MAIFAGHCTILVNFLEKNFPICHPPLVGEGKKICNSGCPRITDLAFFTAALTSGNIQEISEPIYQKIRISYQREYRKKIRCL